MILQTQLEQEEEAITNKLMKRLDQLKREKAEVCGDIHVPLCPMGIHATSMLHCCRCAPCAFMQRMRQQVTE